ncbi:MAG TPA: hypothetical protein VF503_11645, partial [Sphingobium sp.]|uniref:hypothetical protein n=1 Tax=Sphingobium sp. TaxID=1912891 RepID=UPI002ED371DA
MDMSVGRLAKVRGERRTRVQAAVIAGMVAGTCLIAVPASLLELVFSSIGLSELVPALAPPIGWPVRIALALLATAVAAAIAGVPSGKGVAPGSKRNAIMGWTQSLGLHHLARLARGEANVPDHRAVITPAMRAPRFRRSPQEKVKETLARHRADLHPDAPPRAPLMASRDLPLVPELAPELRVVESIPASAAEAAPRQRLASPIRDTTDKIRPRPLPRAPEPLSDSDLNWVRGLLDSSDEKAAAVEAEPVAVELSPLEPLLAITPQTAAVAVSADDSLMSLLGRFEQGVAERVALRDAADAKSRLEESMGCSANAVPVSVPITVEAAEIAQPGEDMALDEALNVALETL